MVENLNSVNKKGIERYVIAPENEIVYPERVEIIGKFSAASGLENLAGKHEKKNGASGDSNKAVLKYDGTEEASIVLDFGRNISGSVEIVFEKSSGAMLYITSGESRALLSRTGEIIVDENAEERWSPVRDEIKTGQGRQLWKNSNTFGAFRYLMLYFGESGEVEISKISVKFSAYRGTPDKFKGWFLCDDEKLNEYYYKAAYTLNLCTIKSDEGYVRGRKEKLCEGDWALVDGAKRDRLLWICDLNVSAASMYATFGETEIIRNALAESVKGQLEEGNIPASSLIGFVKPAVYAFYECSQWWIYVFEEYYRYTNDVDFIKKYYANAIKMLYHAEALCDEEGFIRVDDSNNRGCMWSIPRYGRSTINNMLLAYSYKCMSDIAGDLGYAGDKEKFSRKWENLRAAINEKLLDSKVKAYIDSENNPENHPLPENAWAVNMGIATVEKRKPILDYIAEKMWTKNGTTNVDNKYIETRYGFPTHNKMVWPWFVYPEMMARLKEGDVKGAFEAARRTWGAMDRTDANTTYWECFNPEDVTPVKGANNLSHGISTGIIPFLSFGVMGIKPVSSGYRTFEFRPNPGDLKFIAGEVPTPSGPIGAYISVNEGIYEINVPDGLECCAYLPASGANAVTVNERRVEACMHEDRLVIRGIPGGRYRIVV